MPVLLEAIAAESAALRHFIAILEEEQQLLIGGNADAVLPLLERKTALINELGSAGQQREAALQAQGVATRKEDLEAWFGKAAPDLRNAWQDLLALAQDANRLNATNGQLINTRLQHNQQALAILMNAAGSLGDSTYGPDGHQKHGSGSRTLGSA
ncbi:MAG TPA: flagellar protein FlgN [Rhodocyclaceae bacterium]|nr:flagellar protein FlgN [Rhodocyclaceae bacterium]